MVCTQRFLPPDRSFISLFVDGIGICIRLLGVNIKIFGPFSGRRSRAEIAGEKMGGRP